MEVDKYAKYLKEIIMSQVPPIMCNVCRNMAYARESTYNHHGKTYNEIRWVCPNCGSLVRCDESEVSNNER